MDEPRAPRLIRAQHRLKGRVTGMAIEHGGWRAGRDRHGRRRAGRSRDRRGGAWIAIDSGGAVVFSFKATAVQSF